jgi:hypothetical protein
MTFVIVCKIEPDAAGVTEEQIRNRLDAALKASTASEALSAAVGGTVGLHLAPETLDGWKQLLAGFREA